VKHTRPKAIHLFLNIAKAMPVKSIKNDNHCAIPILALPDKVRAKREFIPLGVSRIWKAS
jgi:hypothetical protein